MVTMLDVARRAGVTKQTVSNVINGRIWVSPKTRAKVEAAIAELNFVPNLVARSLATGSTQTIGFIVPSVAAAFYAEMIEEVADVLDEQQYHLLIAATHHDSAICTRHLVGLAGRSVDGVLVADDGRFPEHTMRAAFPIVMCARESEIPIALPVVTIDYEHAGFLAGQHLAERGHRRVTMLSEHGKRVAGCRRALNGADIDIIEVGDSTERSVGYDAAMAALRQQPRPTALFATTDVLALGAMDAAARLGLRVPEDLSVVGLDDISESRSHHPALTTVAFPKREMAREAIKLLLRAVEDGEPLPDGITLLRTRLIERESSGPAPV
jgi:LacI family transcriptional regulator